MKTLTSKEIISIVEKHLPHGLMLTGAENLKSWILINGLDNHGWLNEGSCHYAMQQMVQSGVLIKERKKQFSAYEEKSPIITIGDSLLPDYLKYFTVFVFIHVLNNI